MARGYEFARFAQQLRTRPQRQRLGINLEQSAASQLLDDEPALTAEYEAWRERSGMPQDPACPNGDTAEPQPEAPPAISRKRLSRRRPLE